jgi:hypothetical protein
MALTGANTLARIGSGQMVIPVKELMDQIGDKLTAPQKDALLEWMLIRRKDRVRPGDLITSDLFNQLIADVADLQLRVAKLEAQEVVPSKKVRIDRVVPSGKVPIWGQRLIIEGANFEFSLGAAVVSLDGKKVLEILSGSSDDTLIVTLPDLVIAGKATTTDVLLVVANRSSSASVNLAVRRKTGASVGEVIKG